MVDMLDVDATGEGSLIFAAVFYNFNAARALVAPFTRAASVVRGSVRAFVTGL